MPRYPVPPPPDTSGAYGSPPGYWQMGDTIAQLMLRRGQILADQANRSADIWGRTLGNVSNIASDAFQRYGQQQGEADVGRAITASQTDKYPSATRAVPGTPAATAEARPDPGADHLKAIMDSVSPELRPKVQAGIEAAQAQAMKVAEAKAKLDEQQQKLLRESTDYGAGLAEDLKPSLALPDGGIGLAGNAVRLAISHQVPGAEDHLPMVQQAQKALADARASGDPAKEQAVVEAWRAQAGPMFDRMAQGMSDEARKRRAETQKALAEAGKPKTREVTVTNPDGSKSVRIVEDKPGQSFDSAAPPPTDEFERFVRSRFGATPTAQQRLQAREQWAAAGREPDVAMSLTPQALDQAARLWVETGSLPPAGMGKQGVAMRQAIMNRGAQLAPDADLAQNKAGFGADTASLKKLQAQTDAVAAFEQTASKNAQLLDGILKKIPDSGVTLLNKPVRAASTVLGSDDLATFNTLRQSVQNEYARIISNPGLSGTMSDSARKEAETLLSPDATVGQIRAAIKALQAEAANRHASYQGQIGQIHGRIGGGKKTTAPADPLGVR